MGNPLRLALLALALLVAGCSSNAVHQPSDGWSGAGIAGRDPDDCVIAPAPQRLLAPARQAPSKEEIRSFQDDNCGPDCARKRAQRHRDDAARQQEAERRREAERRHHEIKARELDCVLGSGCLRRGVLAGIRR